MQKVSEKFLKCDLNQRGKDISQCSAESRGFPPGTTVSSHGESSGPSRGGYPGLLPRGPGQKGARTQTVTNLQVLQDMK